MHIHFRRTFRALALIAALVAAVAAHAQPDGAGGRRSGINRAPRTSPPVHDPVIIRAEDGYHMFNTGQGISHWRSPDLVNWTPLAPVFEQMPDWTFVLVPGFRGHTWAPDIAYVNGRYLLYYSVSTFGSRVSSIGLATNTTLDPADPDYRWVDHGPVIASTNSVNWNAIDPNHIVDLAGNHWLTWGSFWGGIQMTRLDPETGLPADNPPAIQTIAARPGSNAVEAPFIIERGGRYYLFVSHDRCCIGADSTYNIVVGRADVVTGPYRDREGRDLRDGGGTLVLAGHGEVRGPGHNAILKDGDRTLLVHHFYDAGDRGRSKLQVRPIVWDDDGWPLAGDALDTRHLEPAQPLTADTLAGDWTAWNDFETSHSLTLNASGTATLGDAEAGWVLEGDRVVLRLGDADELRLHVDPHAAWLVGRRPDGAIFYARRGHDLIAAESPAPARSDDTRS